MFAGLSHEFEPAISHAETARYVRTGGMET